MSEYTPTVEEVLASLVYLNKHYAEQHGEVDLTVVGSETAAQFRRMIASVEREAAARALAEAAEIAEALYFGPAPLFSRASAHQWGARQAAVRIRARAAEIRERGAE